MNNPYSASESSLAGQQKEPDFSKVPIPILYIILGALIAGILFYAGFSISNANPAMLAFDLTGVKWYQDMPILLASIAASFIVPAVVTKASANSALAKREGSIEEQIFGRYQIQFIVGLAFLDMCAFLFIFRFSESANLVFLLFAGLAVFMMGLRYPSRSRLQAWWLRNQPQV